jgi:hypothetical protein
LRYQIVNGRQERQSLYAAAACVLCIQRSAGMKGFASNATAF